jgi:uncharacterized damage-inducible protein DinB
VSKLELIRHVYGYNEWANGKLLDAAGGLSDEELNAIEAASWGKLITELGHIAGAQVVWLHRWREGQNPPPVTGIQDLQTMDEVRALYDRSHADLRSFVSELTDERLERPLRFRDSAGNESERPLWVLMIHVANHGTYHRGEIAGVLTDLGYSPGDVDMTRWKPKAG